MTAAEWVFHSGEIAGRGSDTLAGSKGTYIPLRGRERTVGVMGIRLEQESGLIEPEQLQLMETFAVVIAGALESKELSEAAGKATVSMEAERIKNLVLRSFLSILPRHPRKLWRLPAGSHNRGLTAFPKVKRIKYSKRFASGAIASTGWSRVFLNTSRGLSRRRLRVAFPKRKLRKHA